MGDLRKLLNPKVIAVIGASEEEGSVGHAIMQNVLSNNERRVYPVNPKRESVMGVKCYPTIKDVPERVDLTIVAIPAKIVPEVVEQCGQTGAENLIIISAGFKEIGEEGRKLEERIGEIRAKFGMRILGPNCLGIIRPPVKLNASFLRNSPEVGQIAFISQSGALGAAILNWAIDAHIGFSMFVSLGSMLDVDFGDLIDYLGNDPYTKSIIIYMEGITNARKFMSAAKGFSRNKPIIVLKSGRFSESAKAATSHTGALVGDDSVYDAALKRVGVVRVKEIDDMFNCASVLDTNLLPRGPRLAIVTNAGGPGVMAVDSIVENKLQLASISKQTIDVLGSFLPSYWSKGNPVDVLGDADIERYVRSIEACLADDDIDGLVIIYTPQGKAPPKELAEAIAQKARGRTKPVLAVWIGGEDLEGARHVFYDNDIPTYAVPEEAVMTYMFMYAYKRNLELLYEAPQALAVDWEPPRNNLKAMIGQITRESRIVLTEDEAERFLENYGIQVPPHRVAKDMEEAIYAAHEIGYPIVLKILSSEITHKTDFGGVITDIASDDQLRREATLMLSRVHEKATFAKVKGFYVQKMIPKIDYELILGSKKDAFFGSVILFGMGGIGVEIFRDVSIGLPPLDQVLAKRIMEETRVYELLKGYRNKPPADLRQIEETMVRFSNIVVDFPEISESDINPLVVSDGKIYALDARVVLDPRAVGQDDPYRHMVIMPYPTQYVVPWHLRDGTDVLIRPIRPEDEPLWVDFVNGLSEESQRYRFFYIIKEITREMITRYCNIDYDREIALVAECGKDDGKKLIGISRLIMDPEKNNAEFAVVIADDYQGKGLGYKLVDMLVGIAQERGVKRIFGHILTSNTRMLELCQDLGFSIKHLPGGEESMASLDLH